MAKTTPDMVIQLNVSAPGLEIAVKALTDAIMRNGMGGAIPEESAVQIMGVDAVNAPQGQWPTATQAQAVAAPVAQPQETPKFSNQFMDIPDNPVAQPYAAPAPTPMAMAQPYAAPAPAPMAMAQPQAVAPAPIAPPNPQVTLEAICNAGAKLVEKGQMNQVIALLGKYGVQAVNQIKPEQFVAFAADLRALGAQI